MISHAPDYGSGHRIRSSRCVDRISGSPAVAGPFLNGGRPAAIAALDPSASYASLRRALRSSVGRWPKRAKPDLRIHSHCQRQASARRESSSLPRGRRGERFLNPPRTLAHQTNQGASLFLRGLAAKRPARGRLTLDAPPLPTQDFHRTQRHSPRSHEDAGRSAHATNSRIAAF